MKRHKEKIKKKKRSADNDDMIYMPDASTMMMLCCNFHKAGFRLYSFSSKWGKM